MTPGPADWIAPQTGHDWRDDDVLRAVAWLSSLVEGHTLESRLERTRTAFEDARSQRLAGVEAPWFDPADLAAWMIFQGRAFAEDRANWVPESSVRLVPALTRIGRELPTLLAVRGAQDRAARLMSGERGQIDAGLFELLVALAYKRHGWRDVSFVDERPGLARTPDLFVSKPRSRWAVECKRLALSGYAEQEKRRGNLLAEPVHALALAANRSIIMRVAFDTELDALPDDYLAQRAEAYLADPQQWTWDTAESVGYVREVDWRLAHRVLAHDDVYFGSSRMVELLVGRYEHDDEHSMAAKWRPSRTRAYYASALYQASVVSWRSTSFAAAQRKARYFKSVVAKAASQLPGDRPGVVHVGTETWGNAGVDRLRHMQNVLALGEFDPGPSRLRWVYGNYTAPELTTDPNETWAVHETMVPYKIGRHNVAWPLPGHLLLSPEDEASTGVHW